VDQRHIHINLPVEPYVSIVVEGQDEFNASINLLVLSKMGNLHHIEYSGLHQLLNPRLGDNVRLLPSSLCEVSAGCKHNIVLSISKVEVDVLQ